MSAKTTTVILIALALGIGFVVYERSKQEVTQGRIKVADTFDARTLPDGNVEVFVERMRGEVHIACYYIRQTPKRGSKVFVGQCQLRGIHFDNNSFGSATDVSGSDR